jgi:hypothetical protein
MLSSIARGRFLEVVSADARRFFGFGAGVGLSGSGAFSFFDPFPFAFSFAAAFSFSPGFLPLLDAAVDGAVLELDFVGLRGLPADC